MGGNKQASWIRTTYVYVQDKKLALAVIVIIIGAKEEIGLV